MIAAEIRYKIFSFLQIYDLLQLVQVDKTVYLSIGRDIYWKVFTKIKLNSLLGRKLI